MASITGLVKELTESEALEEAGVTTDSDRGRKQVLLRLNPRHRFVVGVEFEADRVVGLVADLEAKVVARSERALLGRPEKAAILKGIAETLREVIERAGCSMEKLAGIGVADPGIVDTRRGVSVLSSTIQGWRDVPVKEILEADFRRPVILEESTRSKTLCEKKYGAGREADSLMFIEFGAGIGCGLVLGGELYRGSSESAGELGHTRVMENGPVCNCGSYGCLESVASLPAIAARAVRAIREGANSGILDLAGGSLEGITSDHVFVAGRNGDKLALGIIDDAVRYLGYGIANAVNLFNPEMVVFDAKLGAVADLILEPVKQIIRRQGLEVSTRNLKLEVSRMGEEAGALGAATMVLEKVFEIPQLAIPEYL